MTSLGWKSRRVAIVVLIMLMAACAPEPEPGVITILVSDHRDAIGDFTRLEVSIENIALRSAGNQEWIELQPQISIVDLTQLVENEVAQVLKQSVPSGRYDAIKINLTDARGMLATTEEIELDDLSSSARLEFHLGSSQTATVLIDLKVQSQHDHPGGGYILLLSDVRRVAQSSTE